jgi:hypothetical protein
VEQRSYPLTRHSSCTLLCDRIYGLLGLVPDAQTLVPSPDYQATTAEVFKDLTISLIQTRKDLDVFFLASGGISQLKELPTWCVYEASGLTSNPLNPWRAFGSRFLPAERESIEFKAAGSLSTTPRFLESSDKIILQGFIIDAVDGQASS